MADAPSETEMTETTTETTTTETETDPAAELTKWKSLARQNEKQAKANADAAKKLAEIEDANKSEIEKATTTAATAAKEAEQATLRALRLEVAADKAPDGLTAQEVLKLSKRLQGSTKEELEADAEEFFKDIPGTRETATSKLPKRPKPSSGSKNGGSSDSGGLTGKERAAAAFRQYKPN